MRDYAKVSPFFWTKGSGKKLRGDALGQVVAGYLSSAPAANMVGIYYVALVTIANDTGHGISDVRAALKRVEEAGYAFYDFEAELVWIPNHARFEIGAEMTPGDKRRKRVLAELAQVDGHRFAMAFRELYGVAYRLGTPSCPPMPAVGPVAPETKPLPDSESTLDGASADREQDRTGQDQIRTDQGERAREGSVVVEASMAFADDARAVWDTETMNAPVTTPLETVWSLFCGHFADQVFPSRRAMMGRWKNWITRQRGLDAKARQAEADRKDAFARAAPRAPPEAKAPYHAPFRPPSEPEPVSTENLREGLKKLVGALGT